MQLKLICSGFTKKWIALLALLPFALQGQQLYFRNYTIDNGLPSSEIHGMFQDYKGRMWFSGDKGIARFDGRNFVTYTTANGLPENCILNFFVESPRKVWMYSISHGVYSFDPGIEKPLFCRYPALNDSLDPVMNSNLMSRAYIRNVNFLENGNALLTFLTGFGHIEIDRAGKITLHKSGIHNLFTGGNYHLCVSFLKDQERLIPLIDIEPPVNPADTIMHRLLIAAPDKAVYDFQLPPDDYFLELAIADYFQQGDALFFTFSNLLFKLTPGKLEHYNFPAKIHKIANWKNDILVATLNGCFRIDTGFQHVDTIMADNGVSNIFIDHEDGLWLSTLQEGVFYHPPQGVMQLSLKGYTPIAATNVLRIGDYMTVTDYGRGITIFHAGLQTKGVYCPNVIYSTRIFNAKSDTLDRYLSDSDIAPIKSRRVWSYYTGRDLYPVHNWNGNSVALFFGTKPGPAIYLSLPRINELDRVGENHWLLATVSGVYELRCEGDGVMTTKYLGGSGKVFTTMEEHRGNVLIGSESEGLFVIRDHRLINIREEHGLLSDHVLDINPASDTSFWVATLGGINYFTYSENGVYPVATLTTDHGLISNEVARMSTYHDTLWIPHKKGVSFVPQSQVPGKDKMYAGFFSVDSMHVEGERVGFKSGQTVFMNYSDRLDAYLTQITFVNAGRLKYRYRLKPEDDWILCEGNRLSVDGKMYGEFDLEVQAFVGNAQHTSLHIPLTIAKPFWLWFEFYLLLLLLLVAVGWVGYRIILYRVHKKRDEEHERAQLEIRSIISQMNPHFTFNTINSIQSYIIKHGTRDAVLYLSDFAMLIRKTLDYSRAEYITLADELEFLNLYIELENKRFRNTFEFRQKMNLISAMRDIKWPPLLLQPLIENSIVHALSNVEYGVIELEIEEEKNFFIIVLRDNGKYKAAADSKKMKSSVGLEILRGRIRLHNGDNYTEQDLEFGPYETAAESGWATRIKLYKKL